MNYTLQIWKLDENSNTTCDDPFMSIPFEFSSSKEIDGSEPDQLLVRVIALVEKNKPVIDCAGWEAVVLDENENEVLRENQFYV